MCQPETAAKQIFVLVPVNSPLSYTGRDVFMYIPT